MVPNECVARLHIADLVKAAIAVSAIAGRYHNFEWPDTHIEAEYAIEPER